MKSFLNMQQRLIAHKLTEKSNFLNFPLSWDKNQRWLEVQVLTQKVSYILFINFIMKMPSLPFKKMSLPRFVLLYLIKLEKLLYGVFMR